MLEIALKSATLLPLSGLILTPGVSAQELPHVTEDDPTAKALKYVPDAKTAERPEKAGIPGENQTCANCQFLVGDEGQWRACQLFPGKAVNIDGWCTTWTAKT